MTTADDKLEVYYTEKLWQWIPEVYRTEDGNALKPDVLRSIIEVIAQQAAVARRSIDRLHEDSFIETSDDWAVPYIGDLVGTRLVSALNRAGRRVDVANTIFYRRRKGTPFVLEQLIRDIARIDGALVEAFRRLARMRHGLDVPITPRLEGRFTRTLPGGWANLRSTRGAETVDGPFDEFAHTPDVRRLSGTRGRYNIPKLNFHLYRLEAFPVVSSTPAGSGRRFTFDPSGRDVPLFMPGARLNVCQLAKPWEVRAPIQCGLLGHAEYVLDEPSAIAIGGGLPPAQAALLETLVGVLFRDERRVLVTLDALDLQAGGGAALRGIFHDFLAAAIQRDGGKDKLIDGSTPDDPNDPRVNAIGLGLDPTPKLDAVDIDAGDLLDWNATPPVPLDDRVSVVIDPARGRLFVVTSGTPTLNRYLYGFSADIGAGPYDRLAFLTEPASPLGTPAPGPIVIPPSGTNEIDHSVTYTTNGDVSITGNLKLQVPSEQRPYVVNTESPTPSPWVWTATGGTFDLELEGLWLGIDNGADSSDKVLALAGDWGTVTIRHSTIDPGGERLEDRDKNASPSNPPIAVPSVALEIRGTVRELVVASSIVGRIGLGATGHVEKLTLTDSIVQSRDPATPAIDLPTTAADMARVTVFGDVILDRLQATEVIVAGTAHVTDNQHGCFRFSAALPGSELPRQFHSPPLEEIQSRVFVSRRFGSPGFAQLRSTAPADLLRGAENGSEKGAFSALRMPIRLDSLAIKVDEFKPVGLLPQFVLET
jgi:hypothetical protein